MIYQSHQQLWPLSEDSSKYSHHRKIQVSRQCHHTTTSIIIIITIMSQSTRNRTAAMRRRRGWDRMGGCSIATLDSHGRTSLNEPIYSPGYFSRQAPTLNDRNFSERAFSVGIGGPVATGKTALMLDLCRFLRDKYSLADVTNDIFTKEDGEFLVKNGALPEERIRAVETGGCPHAAIRKDISINLGPLEELSNLSKADLLLCESSGADYIIYIIDVSAGDKIPRKGGPGITQADLLEFKDYKNFEECLAYKGLHDKEWTF